MPIQHDELVNLIKNKLPGANVEARDLAGDNDHWEVKITWNGFSGKNMVAQHRMVQEAVKEKDIHALSIKTAAN